MMDVRECLDDDALIGVSASLHSTNVGPSQRKPWADSIGWMDRACQCHPNHRRLRVRGQRMSEWVVAWWERKDAAHFPQDMVPPYWPTTT